MFGPKELDVRNVYNPNLQDIQESAERTYGEANAFFEMVELYLKNLRTKINTLSAKEIYDRSNAIASDLAKCCEMFLKALYIFEHNIPGNSIDLIWQKLKTSEYKMDIYGNPIYITEDFKGNRRYIYVKVDKAGNRELDEKGKNIYVDKDGNVYAEGKQGKKIKQNGHQIDRLIDLLSFDSRLLLETRMRTIPSGITERYNSISVLDFLINNGIASREEKMSQQEYDEWIELHKKTFEEARYAGQKKHNINIEFLYHLATQIKAVEQYKIEPNSNQKFSITEAELKQLPIEIQQLSLKDEKLLSEKLIKLVANDILAKDKLVSLLSCKYITFFRGVKANDFYQMIQQFELSEINCLVYLSYLILNYDRIENIDRKKAKNLDGIFNVATIFRGYNVGISQILGLCVQLKSSLKVVINNQFFIELYNVLRDIVNNLRNNYMINDVLDLDKVEKVLKNNSL